MATTQIATKRSLWGETMKQRLPLVAAIVLIVALVAVLAMSDRYRIVTGGRHTLKIDRLTGATWRLSSNSLEWVRIGERSSSRSTELPEPSVNSSNRPTTTDAVNANDSAMTTTDSSITDATASATEATSTTATTGMPIP